VQDFFAKGVDFFGVVWYNMYVNKRNEVFTMLITPSIHRKMLKPMIEDALRANPEAEYADFAKAILVEITEAEQKAEADRRRKQEKIRKYYEKIRKTP
jgi:hypothetical protein